MSKLRVFSVATLAFAVTASPAARAEMGLVTESSLRARFGVKRGEALTLAEPVEDRVRGLERLGASTSPRAVTRLIDVLEPGGSASSPEERLTAVRALALHAREPEVRRALVRVLGGHATPSSTDSRTTLDDLAQDTAGIALARAGTPDALAALGRELDGPGRAANASIAALVAYPPANLDPLLGAARFNSERLAAALDALGDQRAFERLRELVRLGAPETRARAAIALTRLGDYETVELARHWQEADTPAPMRQAAAEILAMAHAPDANAAIEALLTGTTAAAGVDLATRAPSPALVPALARLLDAADSEHATATIRALGRAGGADAAARLATLLPRDALSAAAASALAKMPGADADRALAGALTSPKTTRIAALAATVRYLTIGSVVPGFRAALARLKASKDPADRAASAAGSAALDEAQVGALLRAEDPAIAQAAAALLPMATPSAGSVAATRLATERDILTRTALAAALVFPPAEASVPRTVLAGLIDDRTAAAPLAARALAAREDAAHEMDTNALLTAPDPELRAHAALGLGRSALPDATGRLASAYRFETDPDVRGAIVRALSQRSDARRERALELARTLDPDATVRLLATRASAGVRLPDVTRGSEVDLVGLRGREAPDPRNVGFSARAPGGLALPASTGPGGMVVLGGLVQGPVVVRVAPGEKPDNDSARGDSGNPKSSSSDRIQGP